jgi:hypothetical protein
MTSITLIKLLKEVSNDIYPGYQKFLDKVLSGNSIYYANMTNMAKENFEEYCSLMFSVLDAYESKVIEKNTVLIYTKRDVIQECLDT